MQALENIYLLSRGPSRHVSNLYGSNFFTYSSSCTSLHSGRIRSQCKLFISLPKDGLNDLTSSPLIAEYCSYTEFSPSANLDVFYITQQHSSWLSQYLALSPRSCSASLFKLFGKRWQVRCRRNWEVIALMCDYIFWSPVPSTPSQILPF